MRLFVRIASGFAASFRGFYGYGECCPCPRWGMRVVDDFRRPHMEGRGGFIGCPRHLRLVGEIVERESRQGASIARLFGVLQCGGATQGVSREERAIHRVQLGHRRPRLLQRPLHANGAPLHHLKQGRRRPFRQALPSGLPLSGDEPRQFAESRRRESLPLSKTSFSPPCFVFSERAVPFGRKSFVSPFPLREAATT